MLVMCSLANIYWIGGLSLFSGHRALWATLVLGIAVGTSTSSAEEENPLPQREVVFLSIEYLPCKWEDDLLESRILRELVRQAVLLAARDELALITRDETLEEFLDREHRENLPSEGAATASTLNVKVRAYWKKKINVELRLAASDQEQPIWKKEYPCNVYSNKHIRQLLPKLEADTRGELAKALRSAGFSAPPTTSNKEEEEEEDLQPV